MGATATVMMRRRRLNCGTHVPAVANPLSAGGMICSTDVAMPRNIRAKPARMRRGVLPRLRGLVARGQKALRQQDAGDDDGQQQAKGIGVAQQ